IIASTPSQLAARLRTLASWVAEKVHARSDFVEGIFLGTRRLAPRIGFLFPGQGSPTHLDGGIWRRRFEAVRQLYEQTKWEAEDPETISTRVMQPAIVTAELAGLKILNALGIKAEAAAGHSLGEFTALHWAGAFEQESLLRIAQVRGAAMAELGSPTGAMLAIAESWTNVEEIIAGSGVSIVGFNSPRQTVVAGDDAAVNQVAARAAVKGWRV